MSTRFQKRKTKLKTSLNRESVVLSKKDPTYSLKWLKYPKARFEEIEDYHHICDNIITSLDPFENKLSSKFLPVTRSGHILRVTGCILKGKIDYLGDVGTTKRVYYSVNIITGKIRRYA